MSVAVMLLLLLMVVVVVLNPGRSILSFSLVYALSLGRSRESTTALYNV